jgi:pyruvate decarboxylase
MLAGKTLCDLTHYLSGANFEQLVEVHMPREDAPASLKTTAEAAASRNK